MEISQTDLDRIELAVRGAENRTAGEIVCVIAQRSAEYRLMPVAWAALLALLVPAPLIYLLHWPAATVYLAQLLVFLVVALILSLPALRFRIVPARTKRERAHGEALRQFRALGLHKTERRTGVLIFASVEERYAEIVADAGINDKVAGTVWDEAVADLIAEIGAGRPAEGFIAAIEKCAAVLAQHFPPGTLNRDELPNRLVEL
jgi:putative membrane protein